MRKLFTLLILMLTAMAVNAASYPIKVKGVQITDANKSNVLGDGTVRYQDSNNMLIFRNANITYDGVIVDVLADMTDKLEINFEGSSTFTSTNSHGIYHAGSGKLVLWSNQYDKGKLTINAKVSGKVGIDIYSKANVEISALNLTVNAGSTAIGTHIAPTTQEITFTNCNVSLHGGNSAVKAKKVNLSGCNYVKNYAIDGFNSEGRGTFGGTVKTDIMTAIESYGIKVAGIEVTSYNARDILGEGMPNRTVYFDASTNELTLNNANITTTASTAIFVNNNNKNTSNKSFKIKLVGDNKIVHTGASPSLYICPVGIDSTLIYSTAGGSLDVTGNNQYGALYNDSKKIAFKDCTIKLLNKNAKGHAFEGDDTTKPVFDFINVNFSAESTGPDVFSEVYGLNYYGCFMTTPSDGFWGAGNKLASKEATNKFVIIPGKDNIKPNFYYGDTPVAKETTINSAKIEFHRAMDNFTNSKKMKYHIFLKKGDKLNGTWDQSYDLDIAVNGSLLETEITKLEPGVTYTLRMRAMDEAGNYAFYKDIKFTTKVESYSVIVCGTTLTSANINDFKAQGLTYNPETKVITLDNANISYNAGAAIVVGLGDYTIDLKGKNTVKGSDTAIGVSLGSLIITTSSNGTLSCSSTNADAATISAPIGVLTIKGCTVDIYNNNGYGLSGGGLGGLKIDKANVKAYGKQGSVCDWTDFEMVNCYVDSPLRAEIGGTEKDKNLGIYLNGSPVKGQYVDIKAGANPHIVAPTLPSDANLKLSSTPWNITVEWNAASDNNTSAANLKYWVYVSTVKSNVTSEPWKKIMSAHDQDGAITGSGSTFKLTTQEYSEEINSVWGSMEPNTTFYVTVVVEDEDGNCALYNVGTVSTLSDADTTKPTLPADATISQSNLTHNSVELSWNAASDNITAPASLMYEISYAIKSTGTVVAQVYNTGDKTTTKLTGLLPETTYEVTMDVFDEAGNESYYEKLTFTTLEAPDETKPELPVDAEITASDITATSVKLSWTAATDDKTPADKIKYEIGYGIKDAMTGDVQYTTGTTSFEFTGLKPETTYEFNIAAVDEAGNFVEYATFSVTTLAEIDETAPALPADATITVKEAADNSLTLSWNAASDNKTGAEDLKYEININSDGSWKTVASLKGVTEYKIEGLEPGTSYKIMIFVSDESGNEASYDTLTTSTTGTNAIEAILAADPDVKMYNTSGVLVGKNYRGVVIINGKKYIKK